MRNLFFPVFLLAVACSAQAIPIASDALPEVKFELPQELERLPPGALEIYEAQLAQRLLQEGEHPRLLHELGRLLHRQGRTDEAKRVWTRAAEEDPNIPPADLTAATEDLFTLLEKGEREAAQARLESVEARFADSPHLSVLRGTQALRSDNLDAAEHAVRKAVELGPNLYVTHLNLGRLYDLRQQNDQARTQYLKAVELGQDCGVCWQSLAEHQFKQGDLQGALESAIKAEETDPLQPLAEIRLAKMNEGIGDDVGARRWFRRALARDAGNSQSIRLALADVVLRLGLLEEVREQLSAVLAETEQLPVVVVLASVHEGLGDDAEAERLYRRALELSPDNVAVNNNLAMLLIRERRAAREALALANKAFEAAPKNALVYGTRACALYHAGQRKEAGRALAAAVRIKPNDPWARYCYGRLLLEAGSREEAELHLEGALLLAPEFSRKAEIRSLLGN